AHQPADVQMHRAGGVPRRRADKPSDEQVYESYYTQIVLNGEGFLRRNRNQRGLTLTPRSHHAIPHLRPQAGLPQLLSHLHSPTNFGTVDGRQNVAWFNSGLSGRRIGGNVPGLNALGGVQPGNSIVRAIETGTLLQVQETENHGC